MSAEPTEEQDMLFDATMNKLEDIARHAEAAATALGEGDFEAAVAVMTQGGFLADGTVWETVTRDVSKCKEISDQLAEEEA
jgi:hypothetical protein